MKKQLTLIIITLFAHSLASANSLHAWFMDMEALENQMQHQVEQMNKSVEEIQKQFSNLVPQSSLLIAPSYQNISLNQHNDSIIITISDIEADNVEARLNDANNRLTITTPTAVIIVTGRKNIIGIEAQAQVRAQNKEDEEIKKESNHYFGTSITRMERSVSSKPLLETQTIDYDSNKKELIITIPLQRINKGKEIPINTIVMQETKTNK